MLNLNRYNCPLATMKVIRVLIALFLSLFPFRAYLQFPLHGIPGLSRERIINGVKLREDLCFR